MSLEKLLLKFENARKTFDYRLEKVLFGVAEQLSSQLEKQSLTRNDLAKRMGVSGAYVTKILNGNPNLTIKSLLKLSDALGQELAIQLYREIVIPTLASNAVQGSLKYRKLKLVPEQECNELPTAA
jgi:transcriptional regulator with XRE-family HTH domain